MFKSVPPISPFASTVPRIPVLGSPILNCPLLAASILVEITDDRTSEEILIKHNAVKLQDEATLDEAATTAIEHRLAACLVKSSIQLQGPLTMSNRCVDLDRFPGLILGTFS